MDNLYVENNGKIGVVSANGKEVVSHVLGTDLTLVFDKKEGKTYILVPLTKAHTFEFHISKNGSDTIIVDGKAIQSDNFFRKDACQWIEANKEVLSKIA